MPKRPCLPPEHLPRPWCDCGGSIEEQKEQRPRKPGPQFPHLQDRAITPSMSTLPGCLGAMVKNPPANAGDIRDVRSLGREEEMATHSSILAWRIPWMEEPGRLQSTGLQKSQTQLSTHMNKY